LNFLDEGYSARNCVVCTQVDICKFINKKKQRFKDIIVYWAIKRKIKHITLSEQFQIQQTKCRYPKHINKRPLPVLTWCWHFHKNWRGYGPEHPLLVTWCGHTSISYMWVKYQPSLKDPKCLSMLEVYDTVDLWNLTSHVITIIKLLIPILWKDELNSNGQQFHRYKQNEYLPLASNY
jgi:hypothetical protein